MRVLLVTTDLMIGAHVKGAAKRQAAELESSSYTDALLKIQHESFDLVAVDLGTSTGNLQALRAACPESTKLLAFGPHVHKEKLDAARNAGFDLVFSRGEFHARVDQLLAG